MPHNTKLLTEEKVQLIQRCLKGEISGRGARKIVGMGSTTISQWIAQYKANGAEAFLPHRRNRVYSPELKRKAVQVYLSSGGSILDISMKYKLRNTRQLSNWLKMYNAHGDFNSVKHSEGGSYMKQGRDTTLEEHIQIAKECIATGKNYGELALRYKVSYQQIRIWTLHFEDMVEASLQDQRGRRKRDQIPRTELEKAQIEIEQLKHKQYLAEMENTLLKNWTRWRGETPLRSESRSCVHSHKGMP